MTKRILGCVALVGWLMAGVALQAHHSLAGVYNMKKEAESRPARSTSVKFANPHGSLTLAVKNADGTTTDWVFTLGSATALAARGVGRTGPNALNAGDTDQGHVHPGPERRPARLPQVRHACRMDASSRFRPATPTTRPGATMSFRRMQWTTVALGACSLGVLSAASAQPPAAFKEPPPPYRPAKDAKDLRSVLFNWTWHMGMLRGLDEHELVVSLEYQGKGTVQVDGQPCTLQVSREHQLPDAGPAHAVHVHARPTGRRTRPSKW